MYKVIRILYLLLFLCLIQVCVMGYRQVLAARSETAQNTDMTIWLPKQEVVRLMKYHGADGMMVTPDAAYIMRGSEWIPILKRT